MFTSKIYSRISRRNAYYFGGGRAYHANQHNFSRPRALRLARTTAQVGAISASAYFLGKHIASFRETILLDSDTLSALTPTYKQAKKESISSLLRAYFVYSACSVPFLVDWSSTILGTLLFIPGINQVTSVFLRHTFFAQFVAGETAEKTLPVLEDLRAENIGCLFAYSVEVDENEAAGKTQSTSAAKLPIYKRIVNEMIHSIDVAADFEDERSNVSNVSTNGRRTWVAVKLSALVHDARILTDLSKHLIKTRAAADPLSRVPFPGSPHPTDLEILTHTLPQGSSYLTPEDISSLQELRQDLNRICKRAQERNVRIIIDAEHTWYQPAIDAFAFDLMREFNKLPPLSSSSIMTTITGLFGVLPSGTATTTDETQPLIYNTFQAYLRRTPQYLRQSLHNAKEGNYALGVKLVRGAYHPHELAAHNALLSPRKSSQVSISPEGEPPVWLRKEDTDDCYNACAQLLIDELSSQLARSDNGDLSSKALPRLGVLFGTHNWHSCDVILSRLLQTGLAKFVPGDGQEYGEKIAIADSLGERITFGQLYGMCDDLTASLVDRTNSSFPFVIKYVPYGALSEVIPYLGRRAIENKSVLGNGGAAAERQRAASELRKRIFG